MTLCLDRSSVYDLIKSTIFFVLLANRRTSYLKVKNEAQGDVIYLVLSRYVYFGSIIVL